MEIFLIDAIGPFFRGYKRKRINWSKIPFQHLCLEGEEKRRQFDQIAVDMRVFCTKVKDAGYNSVSLDDVAHLAPDVTHGTAINRKIRILREEFQRLFTIIREYGLDIYLTMDVLTFTPGLKALIEKNRKAGIHFIIRQVETVLTDFPEISGIIFRIGESDGKDVKGTFKSELFLRSSKEVNRMVKAVLPVFEHHKKRFILRNWTVGAYQVGDFIWHRRTTAKVLRGVDSPHFILSMKYGESDFFRYLPLNKHFYRIKVKKIIELQARREYEGCGEYPSFIGWDYEKYAKELESADNVAGMSVWCQTGGWLPFRRLTYLEEEGFWNELNSAVTIQVFKDKSSVEKAVETFCVQKNIACPDAFLDFLRLNDEVIKSLLYIREVAELKLFFRRVRIPPMLAVYWNNIFINDSVRKILQFLIDDQERAVLEGFEALKKIEEMERIASELALPAGDVRFMARTFEILAVARKYYFLPDSEDTRQQLKKLKKSYKKRFPKSERPRYRIKTSYTPFPLNIGHLAIISRFCLRKKRGYRVVDYLFTIHLLSYFYRIFVYLNPRAIPKFARKHAMGIGTIFR